MLLIHTFVAIYPWSVGAMFVCGLLPMVLTAVSYDVSILDTNVYNDPNEWTNALDAIAYKGCLVFAMMPAFTISLLVWIGGMAFLSSHYWQENFVALFSFFQLIIALVFLVWGLVWIIGKAKEKAKKNDSSKSRF